MFLQIDRHDSGAKAVTDSADRCVTYGDIINEAKKTEEYFRGRPVVIVLNDNSVGSVIAYLNTVINHGVPLMLGTSVDDIFLNNYVKVYGPTHIWKPKELVKCEDKIIYETYGYALVKTGNYPYEIFSDLSLLLTTSGSTGSPKLVRHSYNNLESQGKNISSFFNLGMGDKAMLDLPINYTFGLSVLNSHLYAGAEVLITNKTVLDPEYWEFFRKYGATSITGVPYTYELLKKLRFFRMKLPSLNLITQGGGKLSDDLFMELARYADDKGIRFIPTYGQTEGTARMAFLPDEDVLTHCGSIGRAIPEGEFYLVDEEGNKIEETEMEGELIYRGPNVTLGYASCEADLIKGDERKGLLATGDIAKRDRDGYYYIVGRKKRFLKLNGYRVSLDESERIIKEKFNVMCACSGDDNQMKIYIEGKEIPQGVEKFFSQKTGLNKGFFDAVCIDTIPRNEAGKILYNRL